MWHFDELRSFRFADIEKTDISLACWCCSPHISLWATHHAPPKPATAPKDNTPLLNINIDIESSTAGTVATSAASPQHFQTLHIFLREGYFRRFAAAFSLDFPLLQPTHTLPHYFYFIFTCHAPPRHGFSIPSYLWETARHEAGVSQPASHPSLNSSLSFMNISPYSGMSIALHHCRQKCLSHSYFGFILLGQVK